MSTNLPYEKSLQEIMLICRKTRLAGRSHYPKEIRQKIHDLVKSGCSIKQVSKSTGLSTSFIRKCYQQYYQDASLVRILPVVKETASSESQHRAVLVLKTNGIEITVFSRFES
jgi:N-acetyl-gamma-glutamylphosphate reductase